MKRKIELLLAFLLLSISCAFAQKLTVKGTVLDETGQSIIGATVREKGVATNGAQTDLDGHFTLTVNQGATIIVSYVGYKTQEVKAAAQLTIKMAPDAEMLDDVVVVAYGTAKKQSLVGAQSNITSKQLETRPITNVTNALAGAAPGVQSISALGQPGSSAAIRIRGFGSVNAGSAPLFIVDGTVYNGSLADLNPQDIQSLSVLKDAAATALYGSSAGNGVILITTKSGSRGGSGKPTFTFSTNQGFSTRGQEYYDTVGIDDWMKLRWSQWRNQYHYQYGLDNDQAAYWANYELHSNENLANYNPYSGIQSGVAVVGMDGGNPVLGASKDKSKWEAPLYVLPDGSLNPEITGLKWGDDLNWNDALFRVGYRGEYNLSGAYSGENVRSYMSLGHISEQGYRNYTSYQRTSGRVSVDYNATKWLDLSGNVSFVQAVNTAPKRSAGSYSSNSFYFAAGIAPHYPIHAHDFETGKLLVGEDGKPQYDYYRGRKYMEKFNPVYEGELDFGIYTRDMLTSRGSAIFKILPELKFTTNVAYDLVNQKYKQRFNNIMGDQPVGLLTIEDGRYTTLTFNQLLDYSKTFGDHSISALLGHESYKYQYQSLNATKKGMLILGIDEFGNFSSQDALSSLTDSYRKEGYFGRVNYDYSDLYNFSASYRRDGSSRFARDSRWGNFWAVGAGWHISNEEFMKSTSDWLDNLSLRASYGRTGNDDLLTHDLSNYYAYQSLYGFGFNNGSSVGLALTTIADPKIKWETQASFDVALEFSLFNRLRGSVEFFNKESIDLIFGKPLVISTGKTEINTNLGKVRNRGVEFDLKYDIIRSNDWDWSIFFNGTKVSNVIVRLPEANREDGIELDYHKYVEGGSIYDFYLNSFVKVDPDDGVAIYEIDRKNYPDAKGLGEKGTESENWTKNGKFAKKDFFGSSIPDLYGGFGTSLRWKSVDFNVNFAYQLGGKTLDSGYASLMGRNIGGGKAMHKDMLNAWTKPGQITNVPRLDAGPDGQYDNMISERHLISSTALMLKNISLSYTLPNSWLEDYGFSNARISLSGENLFLASKRKGLNPMGQFDGVVGAAGYAFARTVTAGFSFNF